MGTDVAVVIAYRDMGVAERRRSFDFVHAWYTERDFTVLVEAGETDDTFGRAAAINAGVRRAQAEVIVQADPDNLVSALALRAAIAMASTWPGAVFPHDRWLRLTPAATEQVLSGQRDVASMGPADCELAGPDAVGGVAVFSTETWRAAGGFDERFGLWGGDDAAFAYAAAACTGQATRRMVGDVTHLWHPILPQAEIGSPGYLAQFSILAQYRDAAAIGPDAVRTLIQARGSYV